MECNKDEAIKAKEFAEKKLIEKDVPGAKKFASKAQSLFPELEGLSQFLEVLDVYAASERKVDEEVDWYAVLGVDPLADDEIIRRKYIKMALALHPDKNKAVGADGAFKILSEAWSLLSDKVKRAAYNEKRNIRTSYQKVTANSPPQGVEKNINHDFATYKTSSARKISVPASSQTDSTPCKPNADILWSSCQKCLKPFKYLAIYKNLQLKCPYCCELFLATEMPPPVNCQTPPSPWLHYHYQQQQGGRPASNASTDPGRNFFNMPTMGVPGFSGIGSLSRTPQGQFGGFRSMLTAAMNPAQPAYRFQLMAENLKTGCEEAVSGTANEDALRKNINASKQTDSSLLSNDCSSSGKEEKSAKKRRIYKQNRRVEGKDMVNQMPPGCGSRGRSNISGNQTARSGTKKVNNSGSNKPRNLREFSRSETRNMLMDKAKMEIRKKLCEWNVAAESSGTAGKQMEGKLTSLKASQESVMCGMKNARNMNTSRGGANSPVQHKKSSLPSVKASSDTNTAATDIKTMPVTDPDFYDFDKDRLEKSFAKNQVWAAYDDKDGMPRFYAIIHKVLCRDPFKVQLSWLNSKNNSEFGPINWVDCGFLKTSGYFRTGKYCVSRNLNSFSHRVKWSKGTQGIIQIFPKKGDVWALYRNWSADWNELTPKDVIQQYDMVEVLEDYNEEKGVAVAPLVKVAGFKSVFRQHLNTAKMHTIPREEMFRFSHQAASYLITGQEAATAPQGCLELDTAAMPLELLEVIKEAEGEGGATAEEVRAVGDVDATASSKDGKRAEQKPLLVYSRRKGQKVGGDTIKKEETGPAGAS